MTQRRKPLDDDGADRLVVGIIRQAIDDYNQARRIADQLKDKMDLASATKRKAALARIRECVQFFRSGWFQALTGLDGEAILQQLRREGE